MYYVLCTCTGQLYICIHLSGAAGADDTNATRVPFTIRMTWPQKHQDMYVRKERERVLFKAPAASGGRGGVDNYIYGG